jgi:hypothetical protein
MDLARILLFIFKPADPRRPRIRIDYGCRQSSSAKSLLDLLLFHDLQTPRCSCLGGAEGEPTKMVWVAPGTEK